MRMKAGRKTAIAARPTAVVAEISQLQDEIFLLETLMDNVPDYIYFKDRQSRFTRINRYAAARFGVESPALAVGRTDFDFFTEEHAAKALRDEQEIIRTGQPLVNVEEKETRADGDVRWVSTTKLPLRDRDGNIVGTFGISRDITERKQAEEQLQRRAFYDPLTDLPNRALFLDRLQHLFHRARRALGNPLFAVLYLDLDRFKAINDSLGHQAGDELLIGTARRLERCLRPGDTLARLGGDEFTVLLDDISCEADATGVAERIHEELAAPIDGARVRDVHQRQRRHRAVERGLRAPRGHAARRGHGDVPGQGGRPRPPPGVRRRHAPARGVVAAARDRSATRARARRDRPLLPADRGSRRRRGARVRGARALAASEAAACCRPTCSSRSPRRPGWSARSATGCWREACRQVREWQRKYPRWSTLGISVNVSGRQLAHGGIAAEVERALGATGLDPALPDAGDHRERADAQPRTRARA